MDFLTVLKSGQGKEALYFKDEKFTIIPGVFCNQFGQIWKKQSDKIDIIWDQLKINLAGVKSSSKISITIDNAKYEPGVIIASTWIENKTMKTLLVYKNENYFDASIKNLKWRHQLKKKERKTHVAFYPNGKIPKIMFTSRTKARDFYQRISRKKVPLKIFMDVQGAWIISHHFSLTFL